MDQRRVLRLETVRRRDVAFGSAWGEKYGFGAGDPVNAVLYADHTVSDGNRSLEGVWALGLLEDQDVLEKADDGLSEKERDDAESEVLGGGGARRR